MEQERHTQKVTGAILPPLLFAGLALIQATLMTANIRPVSLCLAGMMALAAGISCTLFILAWLRKDPTTAARRLFLCVVMGMHGIWAHWGAMHDWTSILLYALSEAPTCAAFFFLFRKEDAAKAVRTAYAFLAGKTILVDLIVCWYTRSGSPEDIPASSVVLFPPLAGLPAVFFLGIQFAALGIYVYKLTNDPARWKKAVWV